MPTPRWASGAVHIPDLGCLVLGGCGMSGRVLCTAELLRNGGVDEGRDQAWCTVDPMLKPKMKPSAIYWNNRVFVTNGYGMEVLSLTSNQLGQWTLISSCPETDSRSASFCIYNGRILLSCESAFFAQLLPGYDIHYMLHALSTALTMLTLIICQLMKLPTPDPKLLPFMKLRSLLIHT